MDTIEIYLGLGTNEGDRQANIDHALAALTQAGIRILTVSDTQTAKLACLIACYTEMRAGEIQALRMQDIGDDRIYIRHSWN